MPRGLVVLVAQALLCLRCQGLTTSIHRQKHRSPAAMWHSSPGRSLKPASTGSVGSNWRLNWTSLVNTTFRDLLSRSRKLGRSHNLLGRPTRDPDEWDEPEGILGSDTTPYCKGWVTYFWPQVSFWSQDLQRRLRTIEIGPDDSKMSSHNVAMFVRKLSWLACMPELDPRLGEKKLSSFYRQVLNTSGLDLPDLPDGARKLPGIGGSCLWWMQRMFCALSQWSELLQGERKFGDDVCWDKVPYPKEIWSRHLETAEPIPHPEYKTCMEGDLDDDGVLDNLCPVTISPTVLPEWSDGLREDAGDEFDTCKDKTSDVGTSDDTGEYDSGSEPVSASDVRLYGFTLQPVSASDVGF